MRFAGQISYFGRRPAVPGAAWAIQLISALLLAILPARAEEPLAFRTRILPVLSRAGCNSGACHGAATGQGGFKLSLLGYDPEEDYARITREYFNRRIDLDRPPESLLLRKASRQVEHEGGRRLPRGSDGYERLEHWIAAGSPYGPRDLRVASIKVEPEETLLAATNQSLTLRVTASLSDGSEEDVTALALFSSNDDAIAEASKTGEVTTRGCGLTSIMVRYCGQVACARVGVPFAHSAQRASASFAPRNFIDEHILREWRRLGLAPSPPGGDAEFLRRVYLDVIGRLPGATETRAFLASPATTPRRQALVDQLLDRPEFVDLWTMHLADWLLASGKGGTPQGFRTYHQWLREQISSNTPFDQVTRALLTASGDLKSCGPANFLTVANDPRDLAEQVGRIFLGTQIGCARCHAHPADRWTQDDYYGFAAWFARLSHEGDLIKINRRATLDHPKTGHPVRPKLLGGSVAPPTADGADQRLELAEWLTAPDNPLFSRALVNRVWKLVFGRGLVEPVDDLRPTNPATHPALLEALAADFSRNGYNLRRLVRTMVSSAVYELSSRAGEDNRADDRFYSHAFVKPLPAQIFLDAIGEVTGVTEPFPDYPPGTRAVQLIGSQAPSYALDVLGRCSRERSCDSSSRSGGGLAQALHLINGSTINGKLAGGVIKQLRDQGLDSPTIVAELYLRALARYPTPEEAAAWRTLLGSAPNQTEALEDILWTLLNSREFAFNH